MDKFLTINNIRTHVFDTETPGPTLLVMHGWGCTLDTVASISAVASATHRVVSVDLPGFGKTDVPPAVWGVYEYTDFIEELVKELELKKLSLLGHSFGGRIGIVYASRHPEIEKLVLVDAAGVKPRRSLGYYAKIYSFKFAKKIAYAVLPKQKAENLIEKMRSGSGSADYNAAAPVMRAVLSKTVNQDLKCHMPKISAPTLLIWGENDTATPVGDAKIMEKLIPDAGLVAFKGCGHYSFLDNPGQFAAVLNSFLKS